MMKRIMCIFTLATLFSIPAVFSQKATEHVFVTELAKELKQQGWNGEEIEDFQLYAIELDWENISVSEPEIVALALELENHGDGELSGSEKAKLAITLAETAAEMEEAGLDERKVAAVTLHSVRNMLSTIEEFKKSGGDQNHDQNLGEQIRNEIAVAVRNQLQFETAEKVKSRLQSGGNWFANYDVPFGEHSFAGLGR